MVSNRWPEASAAAARAYISDKMCKPMRVGFGQRLLMAHNAPTLTALLASGH
jgi:hypothetical protein